MFLKTLSLRNVRSFREVDIEFDPTGRQWTFLLGENGTGKSTVLRAIALVTAGSDALTELLQRPDDWIRNGTDKAQIRATLVTAENEERFVGIDLQRGDSLSDLLKRNTDTSSDNPGLAAIDDALGHSQRSYFATGYGVSRRVGEAQVSTKESGGPFRSARARSVGTLFTEDSRLTSIESWAMDLDYRKGSEGEELIQDAFSRLLPDVQYLGIDREHRSLMFKTPDGEIPYSLLSDGYRNIVGWIGDFLYRLTEVFDDYKDPLSSRGLLMLDEIELHLHPVWQRKLVSFLTERLPRFQIVTTTHAPLTAHQAGEDELFFVRRDEETGAPAIHHYDGAPNKLLLHQLIRSPMFGLRTLDSYHVASLREELNVLRDQSTRSADEETRLSEVRQSLAELPDWERDTPNDAKQRELLSAIETRLQSIDAAKGEPNDTLEPES